VQKGIVAAVSTAVTGTANGSFKGGNYIGTLANGGVALAPYHDFGSKIPTALQNEVAQLKAGIVDGSIKIATKSPV
jgi:basic membrane protein A